MSTVNFIKPALKAKFDQYNLISDCVEGQEAVKLKGTAYLPDPGAGDSGGASVTRYASYLMRAIFYNVVARTLTGLIGQIFMRDPKVELPASLSFIEKDANGSGVGLVQLSRRGVKYALGWGRMGLFTDFPATSGSLKKRDQEKGFIRPTINVYEPWNVINWRTRSIGSKSILSLVVLAETFEDLSDDFAETYSQRYRVLRLGPSKENKLPGIAPNANIYTVEIYEASNKAEQVGIPDKEISIIESYQPKDASGNYWTEIPFMFVGSENNDIFIDKVPMYDMAVLNIAHYRNSADYEESCFIVGQPTPYFAGLSENWVNNVLKGTIYLGARGAVPLPEKGTAGLLQALPNTMPFEAMVHKEEQMMELGAKLVKQSNVERTATEVTTDKSSETSVLASSAKNVSEGFTQALMWAEQFASKTKGNIVFQLSDDFSISEMSPEERGQLLNEWTAGAISKTEYRENLRRSNVTSQTDEEANKEIEEEQKLKAEVEAKKLEEIAKNTALTQKSNDAE